jgi:hypothetical protein
MTLQGGAQTLTEAGTKYNSLRKSLTINRGSHFIYRGTEK